MVEFHIVSLLIKLDFATFLLLLLPIFIFRSGRVYVCLVGWAKGKTEHSRHDQLVVLFGCLPTLVWYIMMRLVNVKMWQKKKKHNSCGFD
jgi:hypothetical protein